MDDAVARRILELADEGGYLEQGSLSSNADENVALAEYYLEQAIGCVDEGSKDPPLVEIVKIGREGLSSQAESASEQPPSAVGGSEGEVESPAGATPSPPEAPDLPVPGDLNEDAPQVPRDLTELSDREIRRFSGIYQAYLSRVTWLVATKASDAANAKHLREAELRRAVAEVRKGHVGQKVTERQIEQEAESRADVEKWTERALELDDELRKLKALKEIYKETIDRLSREASMRQDEFVRSGK